MPEYDGVPWHLHSGYEKSEETLRERNKDKNWGIFFTVNELDESLDPGKHRTANMVVRCRAVFMDDDNKRDEPRDDFPITPSLIVNSSPGKYHYYWLTSTQDADVWKKVQNGIIKLYDGDNNAKDLSRYLRLPGYNHNKSKSFEVCWTGDGKKYSWDEILEAFPPKEITREDIEKGISNNESKSVDEYKDNIISGRDYHASILSLSYQMVQEGIKRPYIVTTIQGFMNMVEFKDERWQSRYNDIERLVDQAVKKESDEPETDVDSLDVKEYAEFDCDMPWPPGLLGQLAKDAYDMQLFQYKEVAIVSALGLVAGITGRRFNVNGSGLNLYLTLIMNTGMGKDSIGKFINGTLLNLNDVGSALSFCGPARFTGPKAIIRSLENARSQVCVFTEAGLLLKSKAGDTAGISRVLLSLYSKSGCNDVSGSEMFSKDEESLKMLRAPALTIVNEATPDTLLEAFKTNDSLERGELPRQSIYRIVGDKPYMNFEAPTKKLSKESEDKLRHLIKKCASVQAVDDPQAYHLIPEDKVKMDMMKFSERYVNIENEFRNINNIRSIMASRCFLKALRFAGVASVYNHTELVIKWEEWEWAKAMVEYEMSGIDNFFQGGKFGNIYADLMRRVVGVAIIKILKRKYKSRKLQISTADAKAGRFPLYCLSQALITNKDLSAISDDAETRSAPRDGLEKVIGYMERMGYLKRDTTDKKPVYKVTDAFTIFMGDD